MLIRRNGFPFAARFALLIIAISIAHSLLLNGVAHASTPGPDIDTCKLYSLSDAEIPKAIASALADNARHAAYACLDKQERLIYFGAASAIFRTPSGVCIFTADAPAASDSGQKETLNFMSMSSGSCPSESDVKYVPTIGVSEGLFVSINSLLAGISASKEEFARAMIDLGKKTVLESRDIDLFRNAILARNTGCKLIGIQRQAFLTGENRFGYHTVIECSPDEDKAWLLNIDLTPAGLKIFSIEQLIS